MSQPQKPTPEQAALRERAAKFLNNRTREHKREAALAPPSGRQALTREQMTGERSHFVRACEITETNAENRTVELAFSSEAEVRQRFGIEILSHEPGACDLSRLNDGGAFLVGHDWNDQVGVIERASIDSDRRGRAKVRFGKSERAEEILQDVSDGIRRHVSVGYRILEWKLIESRDDEDVYLITKWEPYEISTVPVPADPTVGVGRSLPVATRSTEQPVAPPNNSPKESSVNEKILRAANGDLVRAKVDADGNIVQILEVIETAAQTRALSAAAPAAPAQAAPAGTSAVDAERARVRSINELGAQFGAADLARTFADNGQSVDAFRAALLERQGRASAPVSETRDLGLSQSDLSRFSIVRAIQAMASPHDQSLQRAADFERQISEAAAQRDGRSPRGTYVPIEVLAHRAAADGLSVGLPGATGSNVVATNLLMGSFFDALRNRCLLMQRATPLVGLSGNVELPGQTETSKGYWTSEGVPVGLTKPGFGKIALAPKTVGGRTPITRRMLLQTPLAIEALVRQDLATAIAEAIDLAGFYGTGQNNTPLGIANTPGINHVPFAGVVPTFEELVAMETKISASNADVDSMEYLCNATMRGALKTAKKFPGAATDTVIWTGGRRDGEVNGYGAAVTNQIADGDVFYGNFADVLFGMWGGLDIITDPYTDSGAGGIIVTALQDVDIALRRGKSFTLGRKAA